MISTIVVYYNIIILITNSKFLKIAYNHLKLQDCINYNALEVRRKLGLLDSMELRQNLN